MSDEEFANVALEQIVPSLTNPRKNFNADTLAEVAESIKATGVHQPVLLRHLPTGRVPDTDRKVIYELVCGERRFRASQLAGKPTIPAMIRVLTDEQALEIQIVENLHRDDLTDLEEAEGFAQLMEHSKLSVDDVAAKIGKSRRSVYNRLKLLELSVECKQAMRDGTLDSSRGIRIARIPDSALQLKALQFTRTAGWNGELPSVRDFDTWLQQNVMLKLEHAVFKITDARLVKEAGSCTDCPKRTGANPDLFAEVASADICTDPKCFHGKEDAHRAQLVKTATSKGLRIVDGKEALELMEGRTHWPMPGGYTDMHEVRADLTEEGAKPNTLGQLLGKDAPAPILFIHPRTQVAMELVPTNEAEAVLLAKGLITSEDLSNDDTPGLEGQLESLQIQFKNANERAIHVATYDATVEAIRATTASQASKLLTPELLRAFLLSMLHMWDEEPLAKACGYTFQDGEDEMDAITRHIERLGPSDLYRAATCLMLDDERHSQHNAVVLPVLSAQLNIDTKAVAKRATAAVKAEYTPQIKEIQAKINAQKAPPATAPAARPKEGPGGSKGKGAASKAPPARAAKLSAEEATQGIAAAMQGLEGSASAHAVAPPAKPAGVKVMYRGPNGETWSGRGLQPKWLTVLIADGGTLDQYLEKMPEPVSAWPFPIGDKPAAASVAVDPLLQSAIDIVVREQKASVRLLKTELKVGTTKALELMDKLEQAEKVSACDERGARKVLVAA